MSHLWTYKQMQIKYMQIIYTYRYTLPFKSLGSVLFLLFKEIQQGHNKLTKSGS